MPLPETGRVRFPVYAWVMVFGGLLILGGLGIEWVRYRRYEQNN